MRDNSGIEDLRLRGFMMVALAATIILLIATMAATATAMSPAVISIAACNSTSVALLDDGTVWQWGYAQGSGDLMTPQQVDINSVKQIAAGNGHVLALKKDGTVWAWGSNAHGQLGDGSYKDSTEPVEVQGLDGVGSIAAGKDNSLALKNDGTVWAWGYNSYGQLGDGSLNYTGSPVPLQVPGLSGITIISCGGSHCLALQSNGTVWAWGENSHGILGDGTNESRFTPVKSKLNDVKTFNAGEESHALAVKNDGYVWAWGYNYKGQLGEGGVSLSDQNRMSIGPDADDYNPDIVRGLTDAQAVAAGGSHSVALKSDGTVWVWGSNSDGQLGLGTIGGSDVTSPEQVPGLDGVTAVAAGMYYTLALEDDGTVWAWGSNSDGQIGNSSVSSTASPVLVLMGSQVLPPASPTPFIPTTSPAVTPEPLPQSTNYLLIGSIGLLAVIVIVIIAAAYLLVFRKKGKKGNGKGL